jgi:subtilase family serine protease
VLLPAAALAAGSRRVGSRPSLPAGAQAVGALAQSTPLTVTFTLAPRDPAALAAYAQEVSTPGSGVYRRYLSVNEFAARFGPAPTQAAAARASLRAQGLTPGPLAANGLSFSVSSSAGRLAGALGTKFERYRLRDGRTAYANTSAPQVSGSGASVIQGVIGLNNLAVEKPQGLIAGQPRTGSSFAVPRAIGAAALSACSSAAAQGYTAGQIASAYGFNGLYGAGDTGSGVTVALYELEPYSSADVSAYQACYGTSTSVTNVSIDGGAGCDGDPECGLEDVLDIEDVIGLAPKASIRVYEGPNTSIGAYDTYQRIVTDDTAKVISTSWGECESQVGSSAAESENILFQEAAAQGQSVFAAAGDNGTTDCMANTGRPIKQQAVDDPASQPYVTGVGGTSLTSIAPLGETVWDDYPMLGLNGGAGGGGVSTLWPQPSYQSGFAQPQSSSTCGSSGYLCREVPDVSADADPNTGYAIYWGGSWATVGGTSAAAPTWASLVVLAESSSFCGGAPLGFLNPLLYRAAAASYAADFNDVTTGNNNYDGVMGFSAQTGYDMASGLGSPKGAALATTICDGHDSVTFTSKPANRRTIAGARGPRFTVSATTSLDKLPIRYSANGLPPGVSIGSASGTVSGSPREPGVYPVVIRATDGFGTSGLVSFVWSVTHPTIVLRAVKKQNATKGAYKRIALHASDSVKAKVVYKTSRLPRGLSINHKSGVISGKPAKTGRFTVIVRALDAYGGSARRRFTLVVRPRG